MYTEGAKRVSGKPNAHKLSLPSCGAPRRFQRSIPYSDGKLLKHLKRTLRAWRYRGIPAAEGYCDEVYDGLGSTNKVQVERRSGLRCQTYSGGEKLGKVCHTLSRCVYYVYIKKRISDVIFKTIYVSR